MFHELHLRGFAGEILECLGLKNAAAGLGIGRLSGSDFLDFLESFSRYPADISRLQFLRCSVNQAMFEHLLTQIASSLCFHTLSELSILTINCDFPLQLLAGFIASDFFSTQQTIEFVDLCDCGLDVNSVLPVFCTQNTSVLSLSFSGNHLLSVKGVESISNFQSLGELTLSRLSCTGVTLLGLFQALAQASSSPRQVVLDNLSLKEPGPFYEGISNWRLNSLEILSFCNNELADDQFTALTRFIQAQEHLFTLGLGGTVCDHGKVDLLIKLVCEKEIRGWVFVVRMSGHSRGF
jgi:hypothetical protein